MSSSGTVVLHFLLNYYANLINFSSQGNEKLPPLAKAKNSSDVLNQVLQTAVPVFLCPKLLVESQVFTEQSASCMKLCQIVCNINKHLLGLILRPANMMHLCPRVRFKPNPPKTYHTVLTNCAI